MPYQITERRKVGDTALSLPVMGMGTAHLGEYYAVIDEAESRATLQSAWDLGVRFFDTAPWYGRGLAEHRLGGFLRTMPRDEFQITTKVGRTLKRPKDPSNFDRSPWTGGLNFEVKFDYTHDGIMRSYEEALQRLALPTVDGLLIHDLSLDYHGDALEGHLRELLDGGGVKALQELKAAGDIPAFGMGINTHLALDTIAPQVDLDFLLVAMPYTLVDQETLHTGMKRCVDENIGVIIGSPFASGILATGSGGAAKYRYEDAPKEIIEKVKGIETVCARHGVSLQAAALQFVLAHPAVVSIIPGAMKRVEVEANVASLGASIPAAFWDDLRSEHLIDADAPTPTEG